MCAGLHRFHSVVQRLLISAGYLQIIKHGENSELAAEKNVAKKPIFAERGAILDANGEFLAQNVPGEIVWADATHINDLPKLVSVLTETLKIPRAELSEKLDTGRRYIVLQRKVPLSVTGDLR